MLESLPEPSREVLKSSPLRKVSMSVTWAADRPFRAEDGVRFRSLLVNHAILGQGKANVVPSQLQTVVVSGEGVATPDLVSGWQVQNPQFTASLYPNTAVVEDSAYHDWPTFVERVRPVFEVVEQLMEPKARARVMTRYQNNFVDAHAKAWTHWRKKIRPAFLAVGDIDSFSQLLGGTLTMFNLQEGVNDIQVRSGLTRETAGSTIVYVLDIEANRREIVAFNIEDLFAVGQEQNIQCLRIFEAALEPSYFKKLLNG